MIHSRAFLLLRKELIFLQREEQEEISLATVEGDLFHWSVTITPKNSLWKGGVFKALIHFSGDYNYVAPKVQFLTIPFHPNVHGRTGEVFMDIIHTWCNENNVSQLLQSLLGLFDAPDMKRGAVLNKDAAKMLQLTPHTYRQMVLDCVTASLRVQNGKAPYGEESSKDSGSIAVSYKPSEESRHHAKHISFVDYQAFWKSIATSIADEDGSTVLQTGMNYSAPPKTNEELLEQSTRFQDMIHRYQSIKYGIVRSRKPLVKSKLSQQQRTEHMDELRAMYHHKTGPASADNTSSDVQELLDWTQQLDADKIDNA